MTMRGIQGARQPFFERTAELQKIADPILVIIGDEDDSTHGLAVHLKKHVPRCGVLELPKTRPHDQSRGAGRLQCRGAGLPPRRRARTLAERDAGRARAMR